MGVILVNSGLLGNVRTVWSLDIRPPYMSVWLLAKFLWPPGGRFWRRGLQWESCSILDINQQHFEIVWAWSVLLWPWMVLECIGCEDSMLLIQEWQNHVLTSTALLFAWENTTFGKWQWWFLRTCLLVEPLGAFDAFGSCCQNSIDGINMRAIKIKKQRLSIWMIWTHVEPRDRSCLRLRRRMFVE